MSRDLILGGGQVGQAIYEVLSKSVQLSVIDKEKSRSINPKFKDDVYFMHVCIPYDGSFDKTVLSNGSKYKPVAIIIHSTVRPGTSECIANISKIPVIYSPVRGVHSRFVKDMKRYSKCWAVHGNCDETILDNFTNIFEKSGVTTQKYSNTKELELAKILVDTTYYGWQIVYKQLCDLTAKAQRVDPEVIWEFSNEIHRNLGNRPRMYSNPKGIGGHCVLPNLELISDSIAFDMITKTIRSANTLYAGIKVSEK